MPLAKAIKQVGKVINSLASVVGEFLLAWNLIKTVGKQVGKILTLFVSIYTHTNLSYFHTVLALLQNVASLYHIDLVILQRVASLHHTVLALLHTAYYLNQFDTAILQNVVSLYHTVLVLLQYNVKPLHTYTILKRYLFISFYFKIIPLQYVPIHSLPALPSCLSVSIQFLACFACARYGTHSAHNRFLMLAYDARAWLCAERWPQSGRFYLQRISANRLTAF